MNKSTIGKGAILISLSQIIFMVSGYVINIFLGRFLGPEYYGRYGVVIAIMSVINVFQLSGLPQAITKYVSEGQKEKIILSAGFCAQLILSCILTFTLFFSSNFISDKLNDPLLASYLRLISLIFPFYGMYAIFIGFLSGKHQFFKQAIISMTYSLTKLFIIPLSFFFKLYGAIFGFILAPLLAAIVGFQRIEFKFDRLILRSLFLFSIPLIGFAFLSTIQSSLDLLFIKALIDDPKTAGYFTASQNIARIPYFALSAFATVVYPSISKSIQAKTTDITKRLINQSLRYILILLLPLTVFISSTSYQLVSLFYSTKYIPSAEPLKIQAFGIAFLTLFNILSSILNGAGFPVFSVIISLISVIITALLCTLLIPIGGMIGAAWSTTLGCLIALIFAGYLVHYKFKQLISLSIVLRIIFASIILYSLIHLINPKPLFLPIAAPLFFGIYFGTLIILKVLNMEDWKYFQELMPKFLFKKNK